MSRVHRASIAAAFAYFQFSLTILVGIVMVPFVLERIGPRYMAIGSRPAKCSRMRRWRTSAFSA